MNTHELETVIVFARESQQGLEIGFLRDLIAQLLRDARSFKRLAEAECNGDLTPRQQARQHNLKYKMVKICGTLGFTNVKFGGDPRGFVVKVQLPHGFRNTIGDDGWGIA